jgi:hypothetical protein
MESKDVNPNNDNVVASNLNNINIFLKIVQIELKNECHMLLIQKDVETIQKR